MKFFNLLGRAVSKFWYLIIAFWIVLTLAMVFTAPNLSDLLSSDQGDLLPANSPTIEAKKVIDQKFNNNEYKSSVIIAIEDNKGLTQKDQTYVKELTKWLESGDKPKVVSKVISPATNPDLAQVMDSQDKKATMVVVGFKTEGSAPVTFQAIDDIREHIKNAPEHLKVAVTGESAIVRDYDAASQEAANRTTLVTIILVVIILLVIYRSPIAPIIPLVTIGLSFIVSKSLVAFMAQQGMKIADFTEIFLIVMLFGAGTDYCLFLISRYKEELADGNTPPEAVARSVEAVGEAIASSAATVIVGMGAMFFAQFGLFNKTGPSIAIGVAVALTAGLTLTPALLRMFGKFTFWPVKEIHHLKESAVWDKISGIINRRPGTVFIVVTLILLAFGALSTTKLESYDMFGELPKSIDSVRGYDIFKKHYNQGEMLPVTVVIKSKDNMWSANSINNIYQLTKQLEKLDFVESVRSVAQPNGKGKDFAGFLIPNQLNQYSSGLDKMKNGSGQLADGLKQAANGVEQGRQGSLTMKDGAAQIASGLQTSKDTTTQIADGLGQAKAGIDGVNQTLGSVSQSLGAIANNMEKTDPNYPGILTQKGIIDAILNGSPQGPGLPTLTQGLAQSQDGLNQLAGAQSQMITGQKGIVDGLDKTASGSVTLRDSLNQMADATGQVTSGLGQTKDGLDKMSQSQEDKNTGFFYVPRDIINSNAQLREGMQVYISKGGYETKIDIILKDEPYSDAAIKDVDQIKKVVAGFNENSNFNTPKYYISGTNAVINDMKTVIDSDYNRMILLVIIGVFIILVLLMRGILAPVYLILTILLSYLATMGISVILFQKILGQPGMDWKVPIFMFIMLVALGEDYNILLMSRVKEETENHGVSEGVRLAVKKTGGIITSAGVIMAGTFGSLMVTPLMSMIQLGFAIAFGVLLDTFIVRPILVPSIIILLDKLAVRFHLKPAKTTITN